MANKLMFKGSVEGRKTTVKAVSTPKTGVRGPDKKPRKKRATAKTKK